MVQVNYVLLLVALVKAHNRDYHLEMVLERAHFHGRNSHHFLHIVIEKLM